MISWIRQPFDRFRQWRGARKQERTRRFIEMANMPENVERRRREDEKAYGRLVLDGDGFHLLKNDRRESVLRWSSVRTIRAFKRDFFAYDMICLAFEVGEGEWIEIWEAMVDFGPVDRRMREVFPTVPNDWHATVMLPAFSTNDAVLWRR
jgi:hypothetical protein